MKSNKLTYTLFISLLVLILVSFLGYNFLEQKEEGKKLKKLRDQTSEVVKQEQPEEVSSETPVNENGRIICIGDSLTLGISNQYSYPKLLSTKTNKEVITIGDSNDTSRDASARIGGYELYTSDIVIPAEGEVVLYVYDKNEALVKPFQNSSPVNVTIADVPGSLEFDKENEYYIFTRNEPGEEVNVDSLIQIMMAPLTIDPEKDIVIIFTGTYDSYSANSVYGLITHQFQILRVLNTERYIIVGLTSKNQFQLVDSMNDLIEENHGEEYFLDIRAHILANGLTEAEIEPTDEDIENIQNGYIPSSLLVDSIHGNTKFNQIVSNQLLQKMIELGYISDADIIAN